MGKLFKLKDWLSLEDTCKRLTSTFVEEVKINDLIQLALDNKLNLSWYFQSQQNISAVEVKKDNVFVVNAELGEKFLSTDTPLTEITEQLSRVPKGEFFRVYIDEEIGIFDTNLYSSYRAVSLPVQLEGAYRVHINLGGMKDVLESILFKTDIEANQFYFTGIIVEDNKGALFKLVPSHYNNYRDMDFENYDYKLDIEIADYEQPPYPIKLVPTFSDLVILRADIDKIE